VRKLAQIGKSDAREMGATPHQGTQGINIPKRAFISVSARVLTNLIFKHLDPYNSEVALGEGISTLRAYLDCHAMPESTSYRNIVVVGLSLVGADFIQAIRKSGIPAGYRLVGIDACEYAYWPPASLRASVVPGWEDKVLQPLDRILQRPHLLLAGATVVEIGPKSVRLASAHGAINGDEVPYDKLVIATVCVFFLLRTSRG
jgi:hypothetical protein